MIPHLPPTAHFYMNKENGVGLLITGSGKTATGLSLLSLLSSEICDCSDAYIVSVGCVGGSVGYSTIGDVVLITAACDYDLGHQVDSRDMGNTDAAVTEMEEIAIANAAACYDMLNRVISLRTVVNLDLFMDVDMPESLWSEDTNVNEKFARNNTETLDIFEPAMHNLFDTSSIVIDAILEGKL